MGLLSIPYTVTAETRWTREAAAIGTCPCYVQYRNIPQNTNTGPRYVQYRNTPQNTNTCPCSVQYRNIPQNTDT